MKITYTNLHVVYFVRSVLNHDVNYNINVLSHLTEIMTNTALFEAIKNEMRGAKFNWEILP